MSLKTLSLILIAGLVALFMLPIALVRTGLRGWFRTAREAIHHAGTKGGPATSIYHIETHDTATVDGDIRMDLYGFHGQLGMLAVVHACWEERPDKRNQLVFWISEGKPVPSQIIRSETLERLGIEHDPRPIGGAEKYIAGLVISDSMRDRIRSLLQLACTYTECPGTVKV